MKLLAFTDIHLNKKALQSIKEKAIKEKPDFLVSSGDLSFFNQGLNEVLNFLDKLNIPTFLIPSNHDDPQDLDLLCKKSKNLINLHLKKHEYKNYLFFGYGNEGYSSTDEEFEPIIRKFKKEFDKTKKLIFITHAPIYNTKLDKLSIGHKGNKTTRKFIEELQPQLTICGHFHQTFKKQDKIKNSLIVNPGPDGMILEL
ncbi:MAG TPA: metallophosphoesterase [Candidatus Nanoarchaeia archaeon]|nr:metallophosphoesterase [Candidatus Nanoarchaeia archaeon]